MQVQLLLPGRAAICLMIKITVAGVSLLEIIRLNS